MNEAPLGGWNRVALLGAGVAALILVFEIVPRFGEVFRLAGEWRALRAQLVEADQAPAELQSLGVENERLERELDRLLVSLPRRDQLSAVLGELQRHAFETEVTLRRIEPGAPVPERTHEVLPLSLEVDGSFHAVGRFVDRVERSALLMRVNTLDIHSQRGATGSVATTIELEAIRLGADPETASPEAGIGEAQGRGTR